jgi:hypothetical protein
MRAIRTRPRNIRVGDLVGGRRVISLEPTRNGILVSCRGKRSWDLLPEDRFIDVMRPDRVAMQALVQASASL